MRARAIHEDHIVLSFEEKGSSKNLTVIWQIIVMTNSVAEEISIAEETALLGDDENGNTESQEIMMQGLVKLITSINENMVAMASSVALLGSNLKRSCDDCPDNSRPNKKQKTRNDPTCNDEQHPGNESDSSSHSDSAELRAIMLPKDKATTSTAEPSNLLSQIANDFDD